MIIVKYYKPYIEKKRILTRIKVNIHLSAISADLGSI